MKAALAIARRDLVRWFTSVTGYVFITVFIAGCAAAQVFPAKFFLDNIANLAPLNYFFPYILLFFAPAIAMGTWADERRHGTDELLFSLPASDAAIVAGKYLAALGIYGVALLFSLTLVGVLGFLGRPDLGLMAGTYLGYAFLGAALIAIAMVASLLVESVTVGFILGAVFCLVPVALGDIPNVVGELISSLGVRLAFRDFSVGVVSLEGIVYFAGLAAFGLVLNLYLIHQRRLRSGKWHLPLRLACFVVSFIALGVLADRTGMRLDVTAERLHSLAPQTRESVKSIPADKPVFIQAYVSPAVPREYVETRENLLALLREINALGRGKVHVRVTEATKASDAAREAEDRFRIRPVRMTEREGGGGGKLDVFLGFAVTCGLDEVVVPFVYKGLSPEYEVTRSIRAVLNAKRAKVGILATDAKWFGGFDFTSMQQSRPWEIVEELKRQYEVVSVPPDAPIAEAMDVLIVPMPSSLPQVQLDHLLMYVKQGKPVLLLDDPLPVENPGIGANEARGGRRGMMGGAQPEPKGNAREFYRLLGLAWDPLDIVWDKYNPHPTIEVYPEVVFVGPGNGATEPFALKSPVTSRLQEMVMIFGGCVRSGGVKGIDVTPLVRAGRASGIISYNDTWQNNPFMGGGGINPRRRHVDSPGLEEPIFAARVQGKAEEIAVDAIFIGDLDFISTQFFDLRRQGLEHLNFDNVTFVLNCVDALVRDEAMIELRSRRPRHRTLEKQEEAIREFRKKQAEEVRAAEVKADKRLEEAKARFNEAVQKIESRSDLDAQTKEIMTQAVKETEERKLEVEKRKIEDEKEGAIARSEGERDNQISAIERLIRIMAIGGACLPAILAMIAAFVLTIRRELEARR